MQIKVESVPLSLPAKESREITQPWAVQAENLVRRFGGVAALDHVSIDIRQGEFLSLLGPSGCGKTTLLRIIAGLDSPDGGTLRIGGRNAAEIPAHKRPVNTVFQSYALFPHLTVRANVSFGLRMKRVAEDEIKRRVNRIMETTEIVPFAERKPAQLSGGQRQRVALARALVNEPEVLLLDEPLGALDLKLRKQLQLELQQLQRRLGITFIFVTHDQEEALVMSDRIAVMNAGKIQQLDAVEPLYEKPRTRFVAEFLGSCNLIDAKVQTVEAGANSVLVETVVGILKVPTAPGSAPLPTGRKITLAIRPEKLQLQSTSTLPGENTLKARIENLVYCGAETQYRLNTGALTLGASAMNAAPGLAIHRVGHEVGLFVPPAALVILED